MDTSPRSSGPATCACPEVSSFEFYSGGIQSGFSAAAHLGACHRRNHLCDRSHPSSRLQKLTFVSPGPQAKLPASLPPGPYRWSVRAQFKATRSRSLAHPPQRGSSPPRPVTCLASYSSANRSRRPQPRSRQPIPPPKSAQTLLQWSPVVGADSYEVRFSRWGFLTSCKR